MALALLAGHTASSHADVCNLFVDPVRGSDSNNGTSESAPVSSIARAARLAAQQPSCTVFLACNTTHRLLAPVSVVSQVAWRPWPGASCDGDMAPLVSGSVPVSVESLDWSCPSGESGFCSAQLPQSLPRINASDATVYVDGERWSRVRTQTMAWVQPLYPNNNSDPRNRDGFMIKSSDIPDAWSTDPNDLRTWRVKAYHSWTASWHTVSSISPDAGNSSLLQLKFKQSSLFAYGEYAYCSLNRYLIEGAIELLQPDSNSNGDWLVTPLNASADGDVCGGDASPCTVHVRKSRLYKSGQFLIGSMDFAVAQSLFSVAGSSSSGGSIKGINFEKTARSCAPNTACDQDNGGGVNGAAVRLGKGANGFSMSDASVRLTGGHGIQMGTDVSGANISHVNFSAIGSCAINLQCNGCDVSRCRIDGFGMVVPGSSAIALKGTNTRVHHNDITGGYFNGLSVGASNDLSAGARVEYNKVYNNGREGPDGICDYGGIHAGGPGSSKPYYIRNNIFANITAFQNGGEGIYLDVSTTSAVVERNLVYNVSSSPLYWHLNPGVPLRPGAPPVVVRDNILAMTRASPFYQKRPGPAIFWFGYTPANFSCNVVYVAGNAAVSSKSVFDGKPCAEMEDPTKISGPCTDRYVDSFRFQTLEHNVYYNVSDVGQTNPSFPNKTTLAEWQQLFGKDRSSVAADPQFENAAENDFGLKPSSPALRAGCSFIDMAAVGVDGLDPDDEF